MRSALSICKADYFLFILFACWLLVDTLNGYLLQNDYPISISQIYKLFVAICVLVRCRNCNSVMKVMWWTVLYLSLYIAILYLNGESIASSIILVSKFITSLLFFTYFLEVKRADDSFFYKKAVYVLKWSLVVFAINMVLGYLNIGFKSYGGENGFGTRGFFYAINELSGVLVVLFPWVFYYYKVHCSTVKFFLCGVVLFFLAYTLSTKSGIIATISLFLFTLYNYGNRVEKLFVLILLIALLIIIGIYIQIVLSTELPIIQRFSYYMDQNGLIDALTSNRLNYWSEERTEFFNSGFLSKIFGLGGNRTVEMDPFDALLNCGIIGFCALLYIYWKLLSYPLKFKYKAIAYSKVVFFSNLLLVIISIAGGHILFSSMAGMLIALSNAFLYNKTTTSNSPSYLKRL